MRWLTTVFSRIRRPDHIERGALGERAAADHLRALGMRILVANYRGGPGEIDLVLHDSDCLVFVEVKTRSQGQWTRPASAVDARKRRLLSATALCYLREAGSPRTRIRFDIVEVLLRDGAVREVRQISNAFPLEGSGIYPV